MPSISRTTHTINASGQAPGRLASRIALILIGKNKAAYAPNLDIGDFVQVENAKEMRISETKAAQKHYYSHSTYAKGFKAKSMQSVMKTDITEVLRRAVSRMLPKNSHRVTRLKRLKISI
ncbi:50S ribosomal protein L13 [Candidatus Uhrbacteria bacterium]|nr:50S ribosomal protein L13 [Candidatus Uhrbacteria bacterium]